MSAPRKLAAILAADVAGYSRLSGLDEEGTHAQLQDHLRSLVNPKIAEHRGRVVKNTGDGLLAEFSSVVDAVRCAVDVQRGMADRNAAVPPEKRVEFRIGINVGDIIIDRGDIFGDGGWHRRRHSRMRWLFVIARNSGFIYKGRRVDVKQVGRELGVRYVLEGGVRKVANRVRIFAQLIDASTGSHIWAERDRDLTDIFAVQDEITEQVAGAIEPELLKTEGYTAIS